MNSDFQIFQFKEAFPVRITDRDGAPCFVAVDVCKALEIANPRDAVLRLDEDEKTTVDFPDCRAGHGAQKFNIISESGLYALIIRSNKPAAREFRKWITAEVLPALRKFGSYCLGESETKLSDPDDDPAKRSTADLVEQINRRLMAGEEFPPHVLGYVVNIARVAAGYRWYRNSFGVAGRVRRQEEKTLLPELSEAEDRVAHRILRHIRRRGKCNMKDLAAHVGYTAGAEGRRRIVTALVESGQLECSGKPGERGAEYYT